MFVACKPNVMPSCFFKIAVVLDRSYKAREIQRSAAGIMTLEQLLLRHRTVDVSCSCQAPLSLGFPVLPGEVDRIEYYQHATKLGGGGEPLLGYVEGALKQGHGDRADVFAAASRQASARLHFSMHAKETMLEYLQVGYSKVWI